MSGAIAGYVIGSVDESAVTKTNRFPLFTPESCFTDNTVMTQMARWIVVRTLTTPTSW